MNKSTRAKEFNVISAGLDIASALSGQDAQIQGLIRGAQAINQVAQMAGGLATQVQYASGDQRGAATTRQRIGTLVGFSTALMRLSKCWQMPGDVRVLPGMIAQQVGQIRSKRNQPEPVQIPPEAEPYLKWGTGESYVYVGRILITSNRIIEAGLTPNIGAIIEKIRNKYIEDLNRDRQRLVAAKDKLVAFMASPEGQVMVARLKVAVDYFLRAISCIDTVIEIFKSSQELRGQFGGTGKSK